MEDSLHDLALHRIERDYMNLVEGTFGITERQIESIIKRIVQDLETRLELKVPTEQMKNRSKAGYDHLHHLQQLCKDEERLLKEWQRDLKDSVPLSQEETQQREEVEDADIKGDKIKFSETHLTGDKKRIYDDLGTSKMLTQDKIRPSEIHLRHTKGMALKEYDEKAQQALTEMFRPGPALLVESTDLKFDEQIIKSYYNILVSDPLFERDSNIVEDIKVLSSELTSHLEPILTEDPKLQGKIEHALRVSLKQPGEGELKHSMSLKEHKEHDRGESSEPIKVQDEQMSMPLQLPIKVKDKQIWTESLQLRGERIALWCFQRTQVHFECMSAQQKRIKLSVSRLLTGLRHIKMATSIPIIFDQETVSKEWSHVFKLAHHCQNCWHGHVLFEHRNMETFERRSRLLSLLKDLETNEKGKEGIQTVIRKGPH